MSKCRLVKVGAKTSRLLGTREGNGAKPFFKWNNTLKKYEYVVSFFDPNTSEEYQVLCDRKSWARITKGLEKAFFEARINAVTNGISEASL